MRKAFTVAKAEYLKAVKTKAFIIGVLLMPLLFGAGFIVVILAESVEDVSDKHFAVVDRSGELYGPLETAATERNLHVFSEDEPDVQEDPKFIPERFEPDDGADPAVVLGDRVRNDELNGYLVIGKDLVAASGGDDRMLRWHTDTPTDEDVPDWAERVLNNVLQTLRLEAAGFDKSEIDRLTRREWVREMGLAEVDKKTGKVTAATDKDEVADLIIPLILAMLIYMMVMMSAPALMNNVLEEKMNKIAEVLIAAVSPFELLLGKLMSSIAMAATLTLIYVGAGLIFAHTVADVPQGVLDAMGPVVLLRLVLFQVLALVMAGAIFAALGAACSELQDAQTMVMPAMLLFITPMFFLGVVLKNPDGSVATALSFFPPATPIIMFLRSSVPPGVPLWQLLLSLVTTAIFALLCVQVGGKIFRIGLLSQGQAPSWRKLIAWVMAK